MEHDKLVIKGARENNLKNIDIEIPKNKLVIMTGLSGSGKTSLAFDTIYAEGQRRYVESLSAYARQFLGNMEKPDVDSIEGLSPAIAIDQKTTSNNPRSTVGTVTEIFDYLRLLYARIGKAYCPEHGIVIESQTIKQMADTIDKYPDGSKLQVLARVVKNQKGTFKDLFEDLLKDGYIRVQVDGEVKLLDEGIELDKNKKHNIDVVIDRIIKKEGYRSRLIDSLEVGLKLTGGEVVVANLSDGSEALFSEHLACPECGFSVPKLEPRLFSFNNPLGACPDCRGLGIKNEVDDDLLIPNWDLSINQGGIRYFKTSVGTDRIEWQRFLILCKTYKIDLDKPLKDFTKKELRIILEGSDKPISYEIVSSSGNVSKTNRPIEGVKTLIKRRFEETTSSWSKEWYASFMAEHTCPTCGVVKNQKGTFKDLFEDLLKDGYIRVQVDGEVKLLDEGIELDKNKKHNIDVVIDRIIKKEGYRSRLIDSLEVGLKLTGGEVVVANLSDGSEALFSEHLACPECGFSVPKLEPRLFSFNNPLGACPDCRGLGIKNEVDDDLLIPNWDLSINQGGIRYFKTSVGTDRIEWQRFLILCKTYKIDLDKPLKDFTKKELRIILEGSDKPISYEIVSSSGNVSKTNRPIEGVKTLIKRRFEETTSSWSKEWYASFMAEHTCPTCGGRRLNDQVLSVRVGGLNISEFTDMSIEKALKFVDELKLNEYEAKIANLVLKEIKDRLGFLNDVGLGYLTLSRKAGGLSGGEAQRIRLATQIGSRLTGVLYVLDEPSIGLHQRDNDKLIATLQNIRDLGNSVLVVEHDEDTMRASDFIVDIGPGAGVHGGEVIVAGTPQEVMDCKKSITGQYLSGRLKIDVPKKRRKGNGNFIQVKGAAANNLKNINVKFPLGCMSVVTGVSGSGKSTLVNEIMGKAMMARIYRSKEKPGKHKDILGLENIDKVIEVSQDPIGRTPRSNPVTYTGVFDDIRDLFAQTNEAKMRGYDKGRFSFNVKGGRCEACQGDGLKRISMHFLPDVYVPCEQCGGKRYNEETLQVTYKDKNIYDVLEMTIEDAVEFFGNLPKIKTKLQTLNDVGLGYIKLGQSATTLSGGEAQRVKLASELQKKATGKTVYILDEPTTGLHSNDVAKLIEVLQRIVDQGDTVIIIEHNLDVIKVADYIVDLGPEGGDGGGTIVVAGTPEKVAKCEASYTGSFLKKML